MFLSLSPFLPAQSRAIGWSEVPVGIVSLSGCSVGRRTYGDLGLGLNGMSAESYKVHLTYHTDQGADGLDDEADLVATSGAACDPAWDEWDGQYLAGVQETKRLPAAENRRGPPGSVEVGRFWCGQQLSSTLRAAKSLDAAHGALRAGRPHSLGLGHPRWSGITRSKTAIPPPQQRDSAASIARPEAASLGFACFGPIPH